MNEVLASAQAGSADRAGLAPDVSVVLTTRDAGERVRAAIDSVLGQSLADFELIVVDDCSSDTTVSVLRGYDDKRMRVFATPRSLGRAGAREQAIGIARGRYIAALGQDDVCKPDRLARQMAYMESHPDTVLLATATTVLRDEKPHPDRYPALTTPDFLWWLLHIVNPVVWSSVMMRAEALRAVANGGTDEFPLAEDYDLCHRLHDAGRVARLDDALVTRHWVEPNVSRVDDLRMNASAAKVLARAYEPWFGPTSHAYADLMVTHVAAGRPVPEAATLDRIAAIFRSVERAFTARYKPDAGSAALIAAEMSRLWWGVARTAIRSGTVSQALVLQHRPDFAAPDGLTQKDLFRSSLIGNIRARRGR